VEDWAEIRRLYRAEGLPIKLIARTLGISRNTVRAALAAAGPPKYERRPVGSAVGSGHRRPGRRPVHRPHRRGWVGGRRRARWPPDRDQRQLGYDGAGVGFGHPGSTLRVIWLGVGVLSVTKPMNNVAVVGHGVGLTAIRI
jgi:transposase